MGKLNLEKLLEENREIPEAGASARRQAAFLSVWDEIQEAYKNGWAYKVIWQTLYRRKLIDFSYSSFMHRIYKQRRRAEAQAREATASGKGAIGKPEARPGVPVSTRVDLPVFGDAVKERDPKRF